VQSPFRLLGQVADEDAELGWTRFRCFDAETGRWLTADPIGLSGGFNPSALDGAPSIVVDPLGLTTGGAGDGGNGHIITEGTVFRGGSSSDANLTPRPGNDTVGEKRGLSTFDTPEKAAKSGEKVQEIDVAKLGPDLEAFKTPDGHVSIRPKDDSKLGDWASKRGQSNDLTDQVRQDESGKASGNEEQ
jgi:RHS repeat-associated protein